MSLRLTASGSSPPIPPRLPSTKSSGDNGAGGAATKTAKKPPTGQAKTVTALAAARTAATRRRRRAAPPRTLTGPEYRRRQRLRLVQVAKHTAAVAAALLRTGTPLVRPAPLAAAPTPAAAASVTRGAIMGRKGLQAREAEGHKAAAAIIPAAPITAGITSTSAADAHPCAKCGDDEDATDAESMLGVPCSYAQLWRGILQLQFPEVEEGEENGSEQRRAAMTAPVAPASTKKAAKTTAKASIQEAPSAPCSGATGAEEGRCLAAHMGYLSAELQELNDAWRRTLLFGGRFTSCCSMCGSEGVSTPRRQMRTTEGGGFVVHPCCPGAVLPTSQRSATLTREEGYTLARYAALARAPSQAPPRRSVELRPASLGEHGDSTFFMDVL